MDERASIKSLFKNKKTNLPRFMKQLPTCLRWSTTCPFNDVIKQVHSNQLNMQMESEQLEQICKEIKEVT